MKRIKSFIITGVALVGIGLLATPSANAGTTISLSFGGGYHSLPGYYQPRPVVYQPVYRPMYRQNYDRPVYHRAPVHKYRNHSHDHYYQPGYSRHR